MVKISNKKGAVELSLNLIIMLIIGMVVLALVIGFVNSLINRGQASFNTELDKAESEEKQKVLDTPGIFAAGPSDFRVLSGGNKKVFIKIYNPTLNSISIDSASSDNIVASPATASFSGGTLTFEATSIDLDSTCNIAITTAPVTIQSKDKQIVTASIAADKNCNPEESFFLTVVFNPSAEVTETESLSGVVSAK